MSKRLSIHEFKIVNPSLLMYMRNNTCTHQDLISAVNGEPQGPVVPHEASFKIDAREQLQQLNISTTMICINRINISINGTTYAFHQTVHKAHNTKAGLLFITNRPTNCVFNQSVSAQKYTIHNQHDAS